MPLTTAATAAEPPPEGKPWNKADNFCLIVRKHDEARGSLGTRQTIVASLCARTIRQGEPWDKTLKNKSSCGKMPQDDFAVLLYAF